MKKYDSIIEDIPWIRPFIDVKTMNIHQKMLTFFEKKEMKAYFKVVMLSLKIYEKTKIILSNGWIHSMQNDEFVLIFTAD